MTGLGDLTWERAEELADVDTVLLVPLGSTEQHGPHLPLGTDTDIAVAIAERAAVRLPAAVVAPAVAYGASGEHQGFPGTLSIGQQATESLLVELVRSAARSFRRIVLVSTHGGNAEPARSAASRLRREGHELLLWSPGWRGDAHAGAVETAVMLAIDPGRVLRDRAEPGNLTPLGELLGELREHGVRALAPNGVLGDPRGASAAAGERLLEEAVSDLVRRITQTTRARPCLASR